MNRTRNMLRLAMLVGIAAGNLALGQTNLGAPQLPPLKSPVDLFRELLTQTPAQRTRALASRTPASRDRLLEKLREYQELNPEERELRLRATELRWWLLPLMRQPATNRAAMLNLVPVSVRPLIQPRLDAWDLLPPPLQQEQLNNEEIAQLFLQLQGSTPAHRESRMRSLPPDRRRTLEAGLDRWTAMTTDQRRATCERFNQYFELNPRERERVLGTLSEVERQQMEETLRSFENLPREKRVLCLRAFEKFARMSVAERQQFLKNAARWEKMTPSERQTWRDLVSRVPEFPPIPPGAGEMPPPLPPRALPLQTAPLITNGGG